MALGQDQYCVFREVASRRFTLGVEKMPQVFYWPLGSPAVAAFAVVASAGVRADEADGSQNVLQFQGSRTRAEVKAEAATVPTTRSTEPAGSRVAARTSTTTDAKAIRAEAAQAVRLGQIPSGEAGTM